LFQFDSVTFVCMMNFQEYRNPNFYTDKIHDVRVQKQKKERHRGEQNQFSLKVINILVQ
jgi:hypothetical protein